MLVTDANGFARTLVGLADRFGRDRSALMPILQEVQRTHFHISEYSHAGDRRPAGHPSGRGPQRRLLLQLSRTSSRRASS